LEQIMTNENIMGSKNEAVVLQEFLEGKEYVVDGICCNGMYKCTAVWEYDKREVNGMKFVYHAIYLIDKSDPRVQQMAEYMGKVVAALGIKFGSTHGEVIFDDKGPVLVEVGARPHGGEGTWTPITRACIGYDHVSATVDMFEDPSFSKFHALPDMPTIRGMYGAEMYFVSRVQGKLIGFNHLEELKSLKSYKSINWYIQKMSQIRLTTDCLTMPGSVVLMHQSKAQLEADIARFQQLNEIGFFIVQNEKHQSDSAN